MSRAGYTDGGCDDNWAHICWRGAVESALHGRRGQAFLYEMLAAMDALPEKKLISGDLIDGDGCVCALGTVALARGTDVANVDPYEHEAIGPLFGIADAMAREIMWANDEGTWKKEAPEERFVRVRKWVVSRIGRWREMVAGDL